MNILRRVFTHTIIPTVIVLASMLAWLTSSWGGEYLLSALILSLTTAGVMAWVQLRVATHFDAI